MSNLKAEVVRQNGDAYPTSSDNRVTVPYHEEYCVRVRNDKGRRAMFMIYIDGEAISPNKFVLGALSDVMIERFVDDLNAGRKFQWLPLDHKEVKDKVGKPETGMVKIVMWWEKDLPIICNYTYHYHTIPAPSPCPPPYRDPWFPVWTTCDNTSVGCNYMQMNSGSSTLRSCAIPAGATGQGSYSGQKFQEVTGFDLDPEFEEVVFFLQAPETVTINSTASGGVVGTVVEHVAYYCPNCGAKRKGRNHVFCPFCGHKL